MGRRPRVSEQGFLPATAGAVALLLVLIVQAADPFGIATLVRERSFDAFYTLFPRPCCSDPVIVVDIDEASLAKFGKWPLSRNFLAQLLVPLAAAQPAAIGFDIFFAGADSHSAHTLAAELAAMPGGGEAAALAANLPDSDTQFVAALRTAPSVVGALAAASADAPPLNYIEAHGGADSRLSVPIDGVRGPYAPIADAALGIGILSLWGEDGGTVRKVPLLLADARMLAPGLALESARVALGAPVLSADFARRRVSFGDRDLPLADGGTLRIHWSRPSLWAGRTISALDIQRKTVDATRLAGAVILIGSSAPEVGALRPTAAGPLTPSVQIEAEALAQIMRGSSPLRPGWMLPLELVAALLLAAAAIALATRLPALAAVASVLAFLCLWVGVTFGVFATSERLIDPFWPSAAAFASANVAAAAGLARTQRLKSLISRRFQQYVAPEVVRTILAAPERLKLDGEMREVTALFTDIEDFTRLTRLAPRELIALLDAYFDGVCAIVTDHEGMVDVIVGDAVHAFFNMPLDLPDHADAAIACALEIVRFSAAFGQTPGAKAAGFGRTRVGIETGWAIVGDVGGPRRFNYTAHGSVANAAARLEAANKEFGTTICVGPGAAAAATRFALQPLGLRLLRGFEKPVEIFTLKPEAEAKEPESKTPPR